MALADRTPAQLATQRELRTLIIDLERVPGVVRAYDAKVNYLPDAMWEEETRTVCWSAKWVGEKSTEFASVWEHGDDYLAERSFELFDQADLVVTYFGKGADVPWLREQWTRRHLGEPSPWTDIDLFSTVRSRYRLRHKNLDYVCRMLDVPTKTAKWDFRKGDAAVAGDTKAQAFVKRYNVGDVNATECAYWALLPHIKPHPHVAPNRYLEGICCPRCASRDVHRTGTYTPGVLVYAAFACSVCKGRFKTTFESSGPSVRAL